MKYVNWSDARNCAINAGKGPNPDQVCIGCDMFKGAGRFPGRVVQCEADGKPEDADVFRNLNMLDFVRADVLICEVISGGERRHSPPS